MKIINKPVGLWILAMIVLSITSFSIMAVPQSFMQDNVMITSNKETYNCQPIISPDGCLIQGYITIQNDRDHQIDTVLGFDTTTPVLIREHADMKKIKSTKIKTDGTIKIKKNSVLIVPFSFYATESGKFDYTVEFEHDSKLFEIRLDPFYNVSYNSSPSLHLIDGDNNTITDDNYSSSIDISVGLSDDSDITTYKTNIIQNATAIYKFDEGTGSVIEDKSGNNNDGTIIDGNYVSSSGYTGTGDYALNFDGINDRVTITDNGQFQFGDSITDVPFTIMAWINIDDMTTFRIAYKYTIGKEFMWGFTGGDNLLLWLQDDSTSGYLRGDSASTQTSLQGEWFHLTTVYDGSGTDEGIQHYINGTPISMSYLGSGSYTAMENTGEDVEIGYGGGANFGDGRIDELYVFKEILNQTEIEQIYNNGLDIKTNAIKVSFNISLDSDNDYYLQTRKTSAGVDNFNVYLYENSSMINLTLIDIDTITTGWSVTPLISSIRNYSNAVFRLFTDQPSDISEIRLIEQIEDVTDPVIQDCQVNDTILECNDYVRIRCNSTDNSFIDHVYYGWDDNSGFNYQEADKIIDTDIYFIDVQYTFTGSGIFNWSISNTSDIVGLNSVIDPGLQFNYSCLIDTDPPVIHTTDIDGTLLNNLNQNFSYNNYCTDDFELDYYSMLVYNTTNPSIIMIDRFNDSDSLVNMSFSGIVDLSDKIGDWSAELYCNDTSGNEDEYHANFTVFEYSLTVITPANDTVITTDEVTFSFNYEGLPDTIYLYINDTLNTSFTVLPGYNSYNTDIGNGSYQYKYNGTFNGFSAETVNYYFNVRIPAEVLTGELDILSCPTTIPNAMILIFIVMLSVVLFITGVVTRIKGIAIMGALMIIISSLYINPCLQLIGFALALFGIIAVMISVFI